MEKTNVSEISVSYRPAIGAKPIIRSSFDAFINLWEFYDAERIALQECFVVGYLNKGSRLLGVYKASAGGITSTVADIRLILGVALKTAATGLILTHNHPSGNLQPSRQDIELTKRIKQAGALLDIEVKDHLIISQERKYLSLVDEGLL